MKIHLFILYIIYKYYLLLYIHTYIPNTLPKQKQTIITLTYSLILLHHLLPTYSYIILSTLKDSNPQSPNPKLGAFTNLAKDATYYSTIHKKIFQLCPTGVKIPFKNLIIYIFYVSSGLVKNFLFNYVPLAIVVTVYKYLSYFQMYVSSGTC